MDNYSKRDGGQIDSTQRAGDHSNDNRGGKGSGKGSRAGFMPPLFNLDEEGDQAGSRGGADSKSIAGRGLSAKNRG